MFSLYKVSKGAKIRNRYNQVPHLTQAYVKHVTLRRGNFWPQEHNFNKLGKGPLDDASYLVVSNKKIFHAFPFLSLCKTCDPRADPYFVPDA